MTTNPDGIGWHSQNRPRPVNDHGPAPKPPTSNGSTGTNTNGRA